MFLKRQHKPAPVQSTPIHQIRNQLTVITLGIEANRPELSKQAVKEIENIIRPLDKLVRVK